MNDVTPSRGSRRRPGGMQEDRTEGPGCDDAGDLRWSMRGRCHAILQELEVEPVDWDVVGTLMAGGAEEIEAAT